jgi:hypothetical protein
VSGCPEGPGSEADYEKIKGALHALAAIPNSWWRSRPVALTGRVHLGSHAY